MQELSDIKKLLLKLSDRELIELFGGQNNTILLSGKQRTNYDNQSRSWMDKPIIGLNRDGLAHLRDLEKQLDDPSTAHHVDKKQVRYLKSLKKMKLEIPTFFRETADPKRTYNRLKLFCQSNDIPDEIISRVVPAIVTYIETGKMRPILFVGEKGCGKTTAVRMLVEEALRIPTEVIKVPQTDGAHGITGDCGVYQSADAGCIAKARLRYKSLLVAYIFDEIDKVSPGRNRANIDDELLSITDESNSSIFDNYLETTIVGLEHCPIFFTANDLQKVNPILADRCMIIKFPNASATRIKSICKKYIEKKLALGLYSMIDFSNYDLLYKRIDHLVKSNNITSIRKHQQLIEVVFENALDAAFSQEGNKPIMITPDMIIKAEQSVIDGVKQKVGF